MTANIEYRYTDQQPCLICGGWEKLRRGNGVRCHGYAIEGGGVYCSQVASEHPSSNGLFWHARPDEPAVPCAPIVHTPGDQPRPWIDDDWDEVWSDRNSRCK